jgi:hypothetical protein
MDCLPQIHTVAIHARSGFESLTPGIGMLCRTGTFTTGLGIIRNSEKYVSNYAFVGWQPIKLLGFDAGAIAGLIDGYSYNNRGIGPLAAISIRHSNTYFTVIPKVKGVSEFAIGVSFTIK